MEKEDLASLVACEVESHCYVDEDFQVLALSDYAWREQNSLDAVRERRPRVIHWSPE